MKRWVHASSYAHGRPQHLREVLLGDLTPLLLRATDTDAARAGGRDVVDRGADGSVLVRLHTNVMQREVAKQIRVTAGTARDVGPGTRLQLSWEAEPAPGAFPRFAGALELEPVGATAAMLTITGYYEPPLGAVGVAVDDTVMRDRAEETAQRLVRALARELGTTAAQVHGAPPVPTGGDGGIPAPVRVRDVMTTDVRAINGSAGLRAAAGLLFTGNFSGAPVVDDGGELIGVLSERDILANQAPRAHGFGRRAAEQRRRQDARTAADACSAPALVIGPDAALRDAAAMMLDHDVSRLIVIAQGGIVGIVTHHDVLSALLLADDQVTVVVEQLLASLEAENVDLVVSDGAVAVSGSVRLRSTAASLPRLITDLDGVSSVETTLRWEIDDMTREAHPTAAG